VDILADVWLKRCRCSTVGSDRSPTFGASAVCCTRWRLVCLCFTAFGTRLVNDYEML